jgi:hypothetical protein
MDAQPLFLTSEEVATLTGRKFKARQIEALKMMAVPFRVNAAGRPVVTRAAIEGSADRTTPTQKWQPGKR